MYRRAKFTVNYKLISDFTFKSQHLFCNIFRQFISYKVTYLINDLHFSDTMCEERESVLYNVSRTAYLLKQHCVIICFHV